jgi:hypothetical protein
MINSSCGPLDNTLAQFVYFGILDEGDGQCFRVNSTMEAGSFILLIGSIVLAILNLFVTRAVAQYFRDQVAATPTTKSNSVATSSCELATEEVLAPSTSVSGYDSVATEDKEHSNKPNLNPAHVLFTDIFACALVMVQDDETVSQ